MAGQSRAERMGRAWEQVKSEPGLARNTFTIIALLVLGLTVGGIVLSQQRFIPPWQDRYVLYATFAAAPGVSPGQGQEVRVAGVQVGQVVSASVDDSGQALLELSMDEQYRDTVYDNAHLILRPKSPLNEMYIIMEPGGPPGRVMKSGEVLPVGTSERPIQIDEVLGHLDENARTMLTALLTESDVALANAQKTLPPGLDAVRLVGNDLRPVATELAKRKEKLRTLVTALGQVAKGVGHDDKRLHDLSNGLQSTLGTLASNNRDVESSLNQLPDLLAQLRRATDSVQGLADELDPALRNLESASDDLPKALDALEDTTDSLDSVLDEAEPFANEGEKALKDLRPFVKEARKATPPLKQATAVLDPITKDALPYLPDLGAFVIQTRSIVSTTDANGGILRGILSVTSGALPPVFGPNNGIKPVPVPALDKGQEALQNALPKGNAAQSGSNVKDSEPKAGLPALPSLPLGK